MILYLLFCLSTFLLLPFRNAYSIPLFARQTGSGCSSCHTSFPEINAYGRAFKLRGYTPTESELSGFGTETDKPFIPISGMFVGSYSQTSKKDATETVEFEKDKKATIQEASLFVGGRITDNIGAFLQWTYDGIEHHSSLDITDFRYAEKIKVDDKNLVYGVTLNNDPTAQDVWNTTPVWSFPYTGSDVAPSPAATTLIEDGLGQQVGGLGGYALWDNWLYGELSFYRQGKKGIFRPLTQGSTVENVVDGFAPYWRLALQYDLGSHYFSVGTFGLMADIHPDGLSDGPTNKFKDYGIDAQYELIEDEHSFTAQVSWIHEKQTWDEEAETENHSDTLDSFKAKVSYYYNHSVGGSFGYFNLSGDSDTGLYEPDPVEGSSTNQPDSRGFMTEISFSPIEILKIGLQYIAYDKFNGSKDNYDGFGRKASDNNTLYLYLWTAF